MYESESVLYLVGDVEFYGAFRVHLSKGLRTALYSKGWCMVYHRRCSNLIMVRSIGENRGTSPTLMTSSKFGSC